MWCDWSGAEGLWERMFRVRQLTNQWAGSFKPHHKKSYWSETVLIVIHLSLLFSYSPTCLPVSWAQSIPFVCCFLLNTCFFWSFFTLPVVSSLRWRYRVGPQSWDVKVHLFISIFWQELHCQCRQYLCF